MQLLAGSEDRDRFVSDGDQIVPYEVGGKASAALIDGAKLITYEGGPHGITDTHTERLNNDLLEFARG